MALTTIGGTFADKPGERLSNGTLLIEEYVTHSADSPDYEEEIRKSFVLVMIPGNGRGRPFATWSRWINVCEGGSGETKHLVETFMSGDYFNTIVEGIHSLDLRAQREIGDA